MGQEAGENVAEVARRHADIDLFIAAVFNLQISIEIIDRLGQNPHEVDRIDRPQVVFAFEVQIREQLLDHLLAIIEVAFDGQIQHIAVIHSRHLQLLYLAHLVMRMQDTDLDAFFAAYALNRRCTGITGGRPENMDNLAPRLGNVGIQLAHKLQRHILERERRSMEQLKHV